MRPTAELISVMMPKSPELSNVSQDLIEKTLSFGAGLFGETDPIKNREASGIFNHTLLTGRLGGYLARRVNEIKGAGFVDGSVIERGHLVSHTGRLMWDYADKTTHEKMKEMFGANEQLGIELLKRNNIGGDILTMVQALGHGGKDLPPEVESMKQTLEFRIAIYADHRTDQTILPLNERMADFLKRRFLKERNPDNDDKVLRHVNELISEAKISHLVNGEEAAKRYGNLEGIYKDEIPGNTLAGLFQLIIDDARTEKELEELGIDINLADIESIGNYTIDQRLLLTFISPSRYERYLRRLQVDTVEGVLFDSRLIKGKSPGAYVLFDEHGNVHDVLGLNPNRSWWDTSIMKLHASQQGISRQVPDETSPTLNALLPRQSRGADRALRFFSYLDMSPEEKRIRKRRIVGAVSRKKATTFS